MIDDDTYCHLSELQQLPDGTIVARQGQYEYDLDTRTLRPIQGGKVEIQQNGIQYIISGLDDEKGVPIENFDHFAAEVSKNSSRVSTKMGRATVYSFLHPQTWKILIRLSRKRKLPERNSRWNIYDIFIFWKICLYLAANV